MTNTNTTATTDDDMARLLQSAPTVPTCITEDEQTELAKAVQHKREVDLAKHLSDLQFENLTLKLQIKYNLSTNDSIDSNGNIIRSQDAKPMDTTPVGTNRVIGQLADGTSTIR